MRTLRACMIAACILPMGTPASAQTAAPAPGNRVGIINIQDAIIRTEEGQKQAKALQEKFAPRQSDLESKKRALEDLQAQLNKGRNTLSEDARNNLIREIDQKNKSLTRENEDASAEFQQAESKIINAIGQKMIQVIDKYAKEKGYSVILDISNPQSPVLYAANGIDITSDIVGLYDKNQGAGGGLPAPSAPGQAAPAARLPVAPPAARPTPKVVTPPPANK